MQMRQKVDISSKIEADFRERYRSDIERQMDFMLDTGVQMIIDKVYNP